MADDNNYDHHSDSSVEDEEVRREADESADDKDHHSGSGDYTQNNDFVAPIICRGSNESHERGRGTAAQLQLMKNYLGMRGHWSRNCRNKTKR